jgi:hypothetical protein
VLFRSNIVGGVAWVSLFTFMGYFFGNIGFIKHNFSYVILAIVFISVLPMVIKAYSDRRKRKALTSTPIADLETGASPVTTEDPELQGGPTDA